MPILSWSNGSSSQAFESEAQQEEDISDGTAASVLSSIEDGATSSSGSSITFPLFSALDSILNSGNVENSGSEEGSSSQPPANQTPPDASGGSGVNPPDVTEPESPGISVEEEAAIHARLVAAYTDLGPLAQEVADEYSLFYTNHNNTDDDYKAQLTNQAIATMSQVRRVWFSHTDNGTYKVPAESKWADKFADIKACYDDMDLAASILASTWTRNAFGAPYENYMELINRHLVDGGKLDFFIDFEQRYPGARP